MKGLFSFLILGSLLAANAWGRIPNRNLEIYCSSLFPTDESSVPLYDDLIESIREVHQRLFNEKPELETILRKAGTKVPDNLRIQVPERLREDKELERLAQGYRELRGKINAEILSKGSAKADAAQDQRLADNFFLAVSEIRKHLPKYRRSKFDSRRYMDIDGEWVSSSVQDRTLFYEQLKVAGPALKSLQAFTSFLQRCNDQCMQPHTLADIDSPLSREELRKATMLKTSSEPLMRFAHPESCFHFQKKFSHLLSRYFLFERRERLRLDQKFELEIAGTSKRTPDLSSITKRATGLRPAHMEASMPTAGRSVPKAIGE